MPDASASIRARVSKNTALLTGAQLVDKVTNFLLVVILVHYLPEETFGQYGFVASYVVLYGVLVGLGFAPLCVREIARDPRAADRLLSAAIVPMALSSLLVLVIIRESVLLTKGAGVVAVATQLAALDLVFSGFTQLFATVPRAHERMAYAVGPQVLRSLLVLAACWMLLPTGLGLLGIMTVVAIAGAVRLALQIVISRGVFGLRWAPFDGTLARRLLREAYPLAITSVFVIVYYKIDAVMISFMRGDRDVGLYTAASTLAFAPLFIALALHQATYPTLAKLQSGDPARLQRAYSVSIKYLAIVGLPIAGGLAVLAPRAIAVVYDERYLGASAALQVLTVALFLMFLNGFMGNLLIVADDQRSLMRIVAVGALLNVAVNLVVIPRYGLVGAASATVLAELVALAASATRLSRHHGLHLSATALAAPMFCGALMCGAVFRFRDTPLLLLVPAGALLYLLLLIVTRTIGREELQMLGSVTRKDPTP